jgi:hypothetical protein
MWIVTILVGLLVAIFAFMVSMAYMSGRHLYEHRIVYELKDNSVSTSIKVLDIDLEPIEVDGKTYYLVKHTFGVTPLATNSVAIKNILEFKEALPEKKNVLESSDFYLNVRVVPAEEPKGKSRIQTNITPEMKRKFYNRYIQSSLSVPSNKTDFDKEHYLTITNSEDRFHDMMIFVGSLGIFLLILVMHILRIRRLKKHYRRFDEIFPDYKDDMKRLLDDAEYLDNQLGVLVKDGILVSFGTEFRVVDLEEAVSASVFRQKSKWGAKYHLTFFYEGLKKKEDVPLDNLQDNVVDLVHYLREVCSYNVYIQF